MSDSRIRRSERDIVKRVKRAWWVVRIRVRISRWWPNAVRQCAEPPTSGCRDASSGWRRLSLHRSAAAHHSVVPYCQMLTTGQCAEIAGVLCWRESTSGVCLAIEGRRARAEPGGALRRRRRRQGRVTLSLLQQDGGQLCAYTGVISEQSKRTVTAYGIC
jgi:hypothetical protein